MPNASDSGTASSAWDEPAKRGPTASRSTRRDVLRELSRGVHLIEQIKRIHEVGTRRAMRRTSRCMSGSVA